MCSSFGTLSDYNLPFSSPFPLPPQAFADLSNDSASLRAAGVAHGDMLYMLYSIERQVEPAYRKSVFECEPRGRRGNGILHVCF